MTIYLICDGRREAPIIKQGEMQAFSYRENGHQHEESNNSSPLPVK